MKIFALNINTFAKWFLLALVLGAVRTFCFQVMPLATSYGEWWGYVALWSVACVFWFVYSYTYATHLKKGAYHLGHGVMWFVIVLGGISVAIGIAKIFEALGMIYG